MGFFSSIIDAGASIYSANKSAKSAKNINQMQIAWEKERANNAHQWEVEDLKKAGLNPVISAGGTGAQTSSINPTMPDYSSLNNMGKNINDILNSAKEVENQTNLTQAQIENLGTQSAKNIEETNAIPQYLKNDNAKTQAEVANKNKETQLINEEIVSKQIENAINEVEKLVETGNFGKIRKYIDKTMQSLQGVAGVAGSLILGPLAAFKGAKSAKEAQNLINTYRASKAAHSSTGHRSYK